jgi:diaminohydroxyphosphoribosylaminopyrimidine deaminase/5-amino-6-(5-phosphoribosylamino)uracil reductase
MQRALDAAARARGFTSGTAWVGAVIVRNGQLLATGATAPEGGQHAEAAALAAIPDARGADLYTILEPCFPFPGKRNPPCSQAIIDAGIARVVVALEDPDPNVAGRGIAALREAGIAVETGDGVAAARELLRPYLKQRETGRPYVIAKFAASLDGRTATATGDSKWITGEAARERAHQGRALADAIMVGSGTVLADDPSLTARPGGRLAARQPVRIILDAHGRISPGSAVFKQPGSSLVATSRAASAQWKHDIIAAGGRLIECEPAESGINLDQLLSALGQRGVISIWAEGGGALLGSLFEGGHVDELWAFIAPIILGSDARPAVATAGPEFVADALRIANPVMEFLPPDVLVRGYTGSWSPH